MLLQCFSPIQLPNNTIKAILSMLKYYIHAVNLACLFFLLFCSFLFYVAPCLPPTSHVTLKGAGLCLSFSLITSNSLFSRRRPYHVCFCGRAALSLALKSTLILPFTHIPTFSQWLQMQGSLNMSCFLNFWQTVSPSPPWHRSLSEPP